MTTEASVPSVDGLNYGILVDIVNHNQLVDGVNCIFHEIIDFSCIFTIG
jgi:hypothetical protein